MVVNVDKFQRDIRNMSISECCKKHKTTLNEVMKLLVLQDRKKIMKKNKKSKKKKTKPKTPKLNKHIIVKENRYCIIKAGTSDRTVIARFRNIEDARIVRDELVECDWDISQLESILERNNIRQLPKWTILRNPNAYIYENDNGTFQVRKGFRKGKGKWSCKYYGTYHTLEEARTIRDEMVDYNWDMTKLEYAKKKHKIKDTYGR